MPDSMPQWQIWMWIGSVVVAGAALGLGARYVLFTFAPRLVERTRGSFDNLILSALKAPSAVILPAFGIQLALTAVPLDSPQERLLRHLLAIALIAGATWYVITLTAGAGQLLAKRYDSPDRSPFAKRAYETRVLLFTRFASGLVVIIGAAVILMTIPAVRELGASILASAGIAGIVAGLAAQSVLANLFAGIQLALTEPIRLGDAVVIEGEFGTIEQIGSSFVIVRTWDLRRIIVPLNYFLQNRFENWTLTTSDLLGVVLLHVDFAAPIEELRAELNRILESSQQWDRKVSVLQVTDMTDRSVQVRALVSAVDPPTLWNLRCEVREGLLNFLRAKYPEALPRLRTDSPGTIEDAHRASP